MQGRIIGKQYAYYKVQGKLMSASDVQPGLISVIMPVYNAEKTLAQSAASILSQSYPQIELILVNDGSKDQSLTICREIEKSDARVRVIAQKNAGPAIARNAALDVMRGEFVMFADSDDRLAPDACQAMTDAMGENDLVIAHYYFDMGSMQSDRGLLKGSRTLSEQEFLDELVKRPGSFYFSALWNKMYRSSLIRQLKLRFDPFLSWGEDFAFNMEYDHAVLHGVSLLDKPVYHYIKNPGSTSIRTLFHVAHSCRIKAKLYQHFKSLYEKKGLYEQYRRLIRRYIWNVTLAD